MIVYVITSDRYLPALKPFAHQLNKHWSPKPEVIVGGFTPPDFDLPANFQFHSIGPFSDYPIERWSNALFRFVSAMPHQVFCLMLEDYWITGDVDSGGIDMLRDYMMQFHYVARMDLTADRDKSGMATEYGTCGYMELVFSNPDSPYHMSLMTALWRKEHLLRLLVPNESPWDLELKGTPRLASLRDEVVVLGTKNHPLRHTLAFRGGHENKLLLDELTPEDVEELRSLGLLEEWDEKVPAETND